jgi:hypothetical protein
MMRFVGCAVLSMACVLLLGGCYVHRTLIYITRADPAPSFSREDRDIAKAIVIEICRAAGFWETDPAERLSSDPPSRPYLWFVSLGAPGGNLEQRSVSISGAMREDHREIRIAVGDSARGEPSPATRQMIADLRAALERAFPGCRIEVTARRRLHLLAP